MIGNYDTVSSKLTITFLEERVFTLRGRGSLPTAADQRGWRRDRKPIQDKWLYIFRSVGSATYAVSSVEDGFGQRVSDLYAGQHMARVGLKEKNPRRTQEAGLDFHGEVYFDDESRMYENVEVSLTAKRHEWKSLFHHLKTMAELVKAPFEDMVVDHMAIDEPNGGGKAGVRELDLPVATPDGTPIRYFFLLSSFRLGPETLLKVVSEGSADCLSMWTIRAGFMANGSPADVEGPTTERLEELLAAPAGSEDRLRLKEIAQIGVVDPYHFAARINDAHVHRALSRYREILQDIDRGIPPGRSVARRHLDKKNNRGSIDDLYFIAKGLSAAKEHGSFDLDEIGANQVIGLVETELGRLRNSVELTAMMLANWMDGPAHRLLDYAVVHDLGQPDDPNAARDRAYALYHWHNVTSLLGFTSRGSAFLSSLAGNDPDNPVEHLITAFRDQPLRSNHRGDEEIVENALLLAGDIVPDLLLRWTFLELDGETVDESNPVALAGIKSRRIVKTMNNLQYFPVKIGAPTSKTDVPTQFREWLSRGVFVVEHTEKVPKSLLDTYFSSAFRSTLRKSLGHRHFKAVHAWTGKRVPSLMRAELKGRAFQAPIPYIKAFLSISNLLAGQTTQTKKLFAADSSRIDRFEAAAELSLAGKDVVEVVLKLNGIDAIKWQEYTRVKAVKGVWTARAGVAMSILGIVSSVWIVYSNSKKAVGAWENRDTSVMIGAGVAVAGGVILAASETAAIVGASAGIGAGLSSTGVGVLAGILVFVGGLMVALTIDDVYETFADSSYFALDADDRSMRRFGNKTHWAGNEPKDQDTWEVGGVPRNWPVSHQRIALENLLARYSVMTTPHVGEHPKIGDPDTKLKKLVLKIEYAFVPPGSMFLIDFMSKQWDPSEFWRNRTLHRMKFFPAERGSSRLQLTPAASKTEWSAKVKSAEGNSAHTVVIRDIPEEFTEVSLQCRLQRPGRASVSLEKHEVLEIVTSGVLAKPSVKANDDPSDPNDNHFGPFGWPTV